MFVSWWSPPVVACDLPGHIIAFPPVELQCGPGPRQVSLRDQEDWRPRYEGETEDGGHGEDGRDEADVPPVHDGPDGVGEEEAQHGHHLHEAGQGPPHLHLADLRYEAGRQHAEGSSEACEEAAAVQDVKTGGGDETNPTTEYWDGQDHHCPFLPVLWHQPAWFL